MNKVILISLLLITQTLLGGLYSCEWNAGSVALLEKAKKNPTKENIILLGDRFDVIHIRFNHTEEQFSVIQEITDFLISVPGHARWRMEEMEREIADPKMHYHEIQDVRSRYQRPLSSMPSPETVKVFGDYLYDSRGEHKFQSHNHPFSIGSAQGLVNLEIRDFPLSGIVYYDMSKLKPAQEWWEAVKAGKKDVSFVGRPEIYRFKEDGSWEMVGKVDAGIVEKELAAKREERRVFREQLEADRARQKLKKEQKEPKTQTPQKPEEKSWIDTAQWIGLGGLLALICAWFGWRYVRRLN
jgi:hypothetical protein